MKTIAYSFAGEGMGHFSRALSLVPELSKTNKVIAFCPSNMMHLAPELGVETRPLDVPRFKTTPRGISLLGTALINSRLLLSMRSTARKLAKELEKNGVDLVVSDFEPTLPRAALMAGIGWISVDNQHRFCYPSRELTLGLRAYAMAMGAFVRLYTPGSAWDVISTFHHCEVGKNATFVGPIHRPDVQNAIPSMGDYLLAYAPGPSANPLVRAVLASGVKAFIYGQGNMLLEWGYSTLDSATFMKTDTKSFAEHLAGCRAVATTAGVQLVGEAIWLGKPMLAVPIPGQWEQDYNAYHVRSMGVGIAATMSKVSSLDVRGVMDMAVPDVPRIESGAKKAAAVINRFFPLNHEDWLVR